MAIPWLLKVAKVPPKGKGKELSWECRNCCSLPRHCSLVQTLLEDDTGVTVIIDNARMKQRPIGPLVTALRANFGVDFIRRTDSASMFSSDMMFTPSSSCHAMTDLLG